jgi:hypothetical protein
VKGCVLVEWHNCSRCGKPCSIKPLSLQLDPEGKKYGAVWFCQTCRVYYTNNFLSWEQIKELQEKQVIIEQIGTEEVK